MKNSGSDPQLVGWHPSGGAVSAINFG